MNANLRDIENLENKPIRADYIEHGRYTKTQYGITTRSTKWMTK